MAKKAFCIILTIVLAFVLAGCDSPPAADSDSEAVQLLADNSALARTYADRLFAARMREQEIDNYTIDQTVYGFYTSDVPDSVYAVAYVYSVNGNRDMYGYKIAVDENGICNLHEEGAHVGQLLLGE